MSKNNNGKYQNSQQDERLGKIETHIETINGELGSVKTNVSCVKTNVEWLMKFFWIIAGASIGSLLASLFNIFTK